MLTLLPASAGGADASSVELHDGTAYVYETRGSDFSTYRAELVSAEPSAETFFMSTTLEGYNVTEVSSGAVRGTAVRAAVVPERVETMGEGVFDGCPNLERVYFMGDMPECRGSLVPEGVEVLRTEGASGWPDSAGTVRSLSTLSGDCTVHAAVIEGEAVVTGADPGPDGRVDIPAEIDGFPVRSVGAYAFAGTDNREHTGVDPRTDVRSVTVPEGVTVIRERAFFYCTSLREISLPGTLETVMDEAFRVASSLGELTIPGNVEYLGFEAFRQCASLRSLDIPDSVTFAGEGCFKVCDGIEELSVGTGLRDVSPWTFAYLRSLETAEFRGCVDSIGGQAFYMCGSLRSIDVSDAVTVGTEAFLECSSLGEVSVGDRLSEIGRGAFFRCQSLDGVELPDTLVSVGDKAFAYCDSMEDMAFAGEMPEFGEAVFLNTDATVHVADAHAGSWEGFPGNVVVDGGDPHSSAIPVLIVAVLVAAVLLLMFRRHMA